MCDLLTYMHDTLFSLEQNLGIIIQYTCIKMCTN